MGKPPTLPLLQLLNAAVGFLAYLAISVANQVWSSAGWGASDVGLLMSVACAAYAGPVVLGGRLADHWGRARTALLGLVVILLAIVPSVVSPGPWVAAWTVVTLCLGSSMYYPGCAALFSEAESGNAAPVPLHVKVSRYSLGWSTGNLVAFAVAFAIAGAPPRLGFALAAAVTLAAALLMARWIALPPRPPRAEGDRSPHPALAVLIPMCRLSVLIACLVGMAFIGLLERALLACDPSRAHAVACLSWAGYAGGFVAAFVVVGRWGGWVFAPWRPWLMQLGLLLGAAGVFAIGRLGLPTTLLAPCGFAMGVGFGAAYIGSLYYSLRLPEGAARAAGIHERFIGIGNSLSPLLGAVAIELLANGRLAAPWPGGVSRAVIAHPPLTALAALGLYCGLAAAVLLALQAALIPMVEARVRPAALADLDPRLPESA
jgi:hypothetical protein